MDVQILNANGEVLNVMVVDPAMPREQWPVPAGCTARIQDASNANAPRYVDPATAARQKREALRAELRAEFTKVTEMADRAGLSGRFGNISLAFDRGEPLAVIRLLLESQNVAEDAELQAIKDRMLALPQWEA